MYRIGQGYDAHRFQPGNHIVLGGVTIPCDRGIEAHSDGDVLLHALCDALLGALALGDIGKHFPDSDARYRGADSRELLAVVVGKVRDAGYAVVNVDTTVLAQVPRLAPHIDAMRAAVAAVLGCAVTDVSVKATTTERMGFVGREEGIAAYATVLLMRHES